MTDTKTAHIEIDLGIPAGSLVCGDCPHALSAFVCRLKPGIFQHTSNGRLRLPACIASEERLTPEPPTRPGYYKARWHDSQQWMIVQVVQTTIDGLRAYRAASSGRLSLAAFDLWSAEPIAMPGGGE